jgi:hypothetical protein
VETFVGKSITFHFHSRFERQEDAKFNHLTQLWVKGTWQKACARLERMAKGVRLVSAHGRRRALRNRVHRKIRALYLHKKSRSLKFFKNGMGATAKFLAFRQIGFAFLKPKTWFCVVCCSDCFE